MGYMKEMTLVDETERIEELIQKFNDYKRLQVPTEEYQFLIGIYALAEELAIKPKDSAAWESVFRVMSESIKDFKDWLAEYGEAQNAWWRNLQMQTDAAFDGLTYDHKRDGERLTKQLEAVRDLMADGKWRTLKQIADSTNAPEASVGARLRDLRKAKFGSYVIERRYLSHGLWEYRMVNHAR